MRTNQSLHLCSRYCQAVKNGIVKQGREDCGERVRIPFGLDKVSKALLQAALMLRHSRLCVAEAGQCDGFWTNLMRDHVRDQPKRKRTKSHCKSIESSRLARVQLNQVP